MLTMEKPEVATAWPLVAGLGPLGALPTAGRLCRSFTVMVLAGWGLSGVADDCELVTGELVANVVQAATGPDGQPAYDGAGGFRCYGCGCCPTAGSSRWRCGTSCRAAQHRARPAMTTSRVAG